MLYHLCALSLPILTTSIYKAPRSKLLITTRFLQNRDEMNMVSELSELAQKSDDSVNIFCKTSSNRAAVHLYGFFSQEISAMNSSYLYKP